MPYLELQNLHRDFGTVKALDGVDVQLEQGEFLSLLGPSGCGKTTALRLVAGFDRPDAGAIVVDGRNVTNVSPNKRDMGMVFQAYSLFPNMTAAQNVEFGLKIRGRNRTERRGRVGAGPASVCSCSSGRRRSRCRQTVRRARTRSAAR